MYCGEALNDPLCADCVYNWFCTWLKEQNIDRVSKKEITRAMRNFDPDVDSGEICIICSKTMSSVCNNCLMQETVIILHRYGLQEKKESVGSQFNNLKFIQLRENYE